MFLYTGNERLEIPMLMILWKIVYNTADIDSLVGSKGLMTWILFLDPTILKERTYFKNLSSDPLMFLLACLQLYS